MGNEPWVMRVKSVFRVSLITGRVSAFAEHFFDVNMTESQRWSNGFHDFGGNFQTSFVEGNHGILRPEQ